MAARATRPTEYDAALRSAFGRVRDVSPSQARDAAAVAAEAGRDELAEQLREYAADLEAMQADAPRSATDDSSPGSDPGVSRTTTSAPAKPKRSGRSRRRSATGSALRQAATEPDRMLAGAIRSTASIGWTIAGGIVLLVIVYLLVTKGPRSIAALREVEQLVKRVVWPRQLFPERYPKDLAGGATP